MRKKNKREGRNPKTKEKKVISERQVVLFKPSKVFKEYMYNTEPTKLTKQIEEITNYKIRKQNLEDEIYRIKNSNDANKENKIKEKLKCMPEDAKHLWTNHKIICISAAIIVVIAIIIL